MAALYQNIQVNPIKNLYNRIMEVPGKGWSYLPNISGNFLIDKTVQTRTTCHFEPQARNPYERDFYRISPGIPPSAALRPE